MQFLTTTSIFWDIVPPVIFIFVSVVDRNSLLIYSLLSLWSDEIFLWLNSVTSILKLAIPWFYILFIKVYHVIGIAHKFYIMKAAAERKLIRWLHILISIPVMGYIYGPVSQIPAASLLVKTIFFPVLALSGFWLWIGHRIKKWKRGKTVQMMN